MASSWSIHYGPIFDWVLNWRIYLTEYGLPYSRLRNPERQVEARLNLMYKVITCVWHFPVCPAGQRFWARHSGGRSLHGPGQGDHRAAEGLCSGPQTDGTTQWQRGPKVRHTMRWPPLPHTDKPISILLVSLSIARSLSLFEVRHAKQMTSVFHLLFISSYFTR